ELDIFPAFAQAEWIGRRQRAQNLAGEGEPFRAPRDTRGDAAQNLLHLVNMRAAARAIEHQREAAALGERAGQRRQSRLGLREMVQHAEAGNVVEVTKTELRQVEQRGMNPLNAAKAADLGPRLGSRETRRRKIERDDLRG